MPRDGWVAEQLIPMLFIRGVCKPQLTCTPRSIALLTAQNLLTYLGLCLSYILTFRAIFSIAQKYSITTFILTLSL